MLGEALRLARSRLIAALGLDARVAGLEAQILLSQVLRQTRAHLLAHPEATLSDAQQTQFDALLTRREGAEPIAYLTGEREFYGLVFSVSHAVLIPRPETELLVELALAQIPQGVPLRVLDLGTGSGAIAITLAKLRPQARVTALDKSTEALAMASANATRLGAANVEFMQGDWFAALDPAWRFDLIVANPPYVAENDAHLSQGDVRFEPRMALSSGVDGLDAIRHIARTSPNYLTSSGHLLFEHGYNQGDLCKTLLDTLGYSDVTSYGDLNGLARVTSGQFAPA